MTDPRFLDATYDDMFTDAWAAYFDQARKAGQGDLIEDDDFDLESVLKEAEARAEAASDPPDDWEPAETWEAASDDTPRS